MVGLTTIRDYDEYTFTHSVNVCIFSVALGKKLGFSKVQLCDLGMAALLHDVGKARVPAEVLNKAGKLDEQEWKIIQAHPWFGALTLFGMRGYEEIPYRSILVAHEHHMKTDLTGYPKVVRPRTGQFLGNHPRKGTHEVPLKDHLPKNARRPEWTPGDDIADEIPDGDECRTHDAGRRTFPRDRVLP